MFVTTNLPLSRELLASVLAVHVPFSQPGNLQLKATRIIQSHDIHMPSSSSFLLFYSHLIQMSHGLDEMIPGASSTMDPTTSTPDLSPSISPSPPSEISVLPTITIHYRITNQTGFLIPVSVPDSTPSSLQYITSGPITAPILQAQRQNQAPTPEPSITQQSDQIWTGSFSVPISDTGTTSVRAAISLPTPGGEYWMSFVFGIMIGRGERVPDGNVSLRSMVISFIRDRMFENIVSE